MVLKVVDLASQKMCARGLEATVNKDVEPDRGVKPRK